MWVNIWRYIVKSFFVVCITKILNPIKLFIISLLYDSVKGYLNAFKDSNSIKHNNLLCDFFCICTYLSNAGKRHDITNAMLKVPSTSNCFFYRMLDALGFIIFQDLTVVMSVSTLEIIVSWLLMQNMLKQGNHSTLFHNRQKNFVCSISYAWSLIKRN